MSDKKQHINSDFDQILDNFDYNDRGSVREIWSAADGAKSRKEVVTEDETIQALASVRNRLDLDKNASPIKSTKPMPSKPNSRRRNYLGIYSALLVAATIVIAVTYSWFFSTTTILAPHGQQLSYTLPDGSAAELNSGTSLSYNARFGNNSRTVTINGEAYFDVISSEVPFFVNTATATIEVTGTSFNVRSWENDNTTVHLLSGSVDFYPANKKENAVKLSPGNFSSLAAPDAAPSDPERFNENRVATSRNNLLSFNNETLTGIFSELERRYNVNITFEETSMGSETLSTFYSNPVALESVLQDICTVKGLQFSQTANGYRVFSGN
ncbi:MAG: FecR domain-containing protein [Balneolales bacterium]|nr:FecR domain-containing protein [Balneolales bacterium]